jgi:hypothetical protein
MLRLVELALFLMPFVIFAVWRFMATEGAPSLSVVIAATLTLLAMAALLVWLSQKDALPPGADYEPARMENGKVVSGHAAPQ